MINRRQLLQRSAVGAAGLMLGRIATSFAAPATTLRTYAQPLNVLRTIDRRGGGSLTLYARDGSSVLHPDLPATPVWGYTDGPSSDMLGPTIEAMSGQPLTIDFVNAISTPQYPDWLPVDEYLTHGATSQERRTVRTLAHLHGGFVPPASDGNPAVDTGYVKGETQRVWYPNAQTATMLWFHDHPHGATRLGVAAGLAAVYLLRDKYDTGRPGNVNNLPAGPSPYAGMPPYEMPLVIQDRQLNSDGTLLYPTMPSRVGTVGECGTPNYDIYGTDPATGLPKTGPWIGEYFGDEMLVNGRVAPFVNVEPRMYRFRILNACNGRFLNLKFTTGDLTTPVPMTLIGTDGGMLTAPLRDLTTIVLNPADRVDVLVDFRGFAGQKLLLRNQPLPSPYVSPAPRLPEVMQFNVTTHAPSGPRMADIPNTLTVLTDKNRTLGTVSNVQEISLDEWNADAAGWYVTLTNRKTPARAQGGGGEPGGGSCFSDPVTEKVARSGVTEEWAFFNNSADTHPIHLHLVQFKVVGRQPINRDGSLGALQAPVPFETGWKDTVAVHPGMVTRIRAKFTNAPALPAGVITRGVNSHWDGTTNTYVYHCHILEHEDNDMMRPFTVG